MLPFALELGRPLVAAVAIAAALVAALVLRARPRPRHAARVLFVIAAALAAGDLRARDPEPPRLRIFVVDRSRSFEPARAAALAALDLGARDLDPRRDEVAVVAFGASPLVALEPAPPAALREGARRAFAESLDASSSDLGAALDLALDVARPEPASSEVVLLTDGRDTTGRARAAAARLAASGIPLHAVAPPAAAFANARVARVLAPARVAVGEAARVVVEVESSIPANVDVSLEGDARAVGPAAVRVPCEADAPVRTTFVVRPEHAGLVRLRARVALQGAQDASPDDDEQEVALLAGEKARALLVSSRDAWRDLLEAASFDVLRVSPEALREALEKPPVADLVVLDEVPASAVPVAALEEHVRSGGGLVVAGDLQAFGPGDYADSDLETRLLPVRSGPPDSRAKPLQLEVVLDASGSMGTSLGEGRTRYGRAVDAVVPPARELRKNDRVRVVTFADKPNPQPELEPQELIARLKAITPGGSTDIGAALEAGLDELASRAGRRLLLLVTDGEDEKVAQHLAAIQTKSAALGADFEAALIAIGPEGKKRLDEIAAAIGAKAVVYEVAEADEKLARLVRGDIIGGVKGERRVAPRESPFTTVEDGLPIGSYAPIRPKDLARTLIALRDPARERPAALAVANERVLCVATDIASGGAALAREGRGQLLGLVRSVARREAKDLELEAERTTGWIRIIARTSRTQLVAEAGGATARFAPVAPGELAARLPATRDAALVRVLGEKGEPLGAIAVPGESALELAPPRRDLDLLGEISGGSVLPDLGELPRPTPKETAKRELARDLSLAALALLVLEGAVSVVLERLAARRAARRTFETSTS